MRTQAWGVSHGGNALVVGRGGVLDVPVSIVQALFFQQAGTAVPQRGKRVCNSYPYSHRARLVCAGAFGTVHGRHCAPGHSGIIFLIRCDGPKQWERSVLL